MLWRESVKYDSSISPQEVVVLTDGLTNHDDVATLNTSSVTLRTTAHVIAVGVAGKGYNSERKQQQRAELGQIATSPQDLFYEASFEQLRDQVDPIARRACPLVYKKAKKPGKGLQKATKPKKGSKKKAKNQKPKHE